MGDRNNPPAPGPHKTLSSAPLGSRIGPGAFFVSALDRADQISGESGDSGSAAEGGRCGSVGRWDEAIARVANGQQMDRRSAIGLDDFSQLGNRLVNGSGL